MSFINFFSQTKFVLNIQHPLSVNVWKLWRYFTLNFKAFNSTQFLISSLFISISEQHAKRAKKKEKMLIAFGQALTFYYH